MRGIYLMANGQALSVSEIAGIAVIARHRKSNTYHGGTEKLLRRNLLKANGQLLVAKCFFSGSHAMALFRLVIGGEELHQAFRQMNGVVGYLFQAARSKDQMQLVLLVASALLVAA